MPNTDLPHPTLQPITTTINGATDLPVIPSLPPLEMPEVAEFPSSVEQARSSSTLPPTVPLNLRDTNLTANIPSPPLPPQSDIEGIIPHSPSSLHSLYPPSGLRKSISVDSFIRNRPNTFMSSAGRQVRIHTVGAGSGETWGFPQGLPIAWHPSPVDGDTPQVSYRERDTRFPLSGRSRGASISTVGDNSGQSLAEDSDNEHPRVASGVIKGKERLRPVIPHGELPLPPKSSALSSPSSISSLSAASSNARDDTPRMPSISPVATPRWSPHLAGPASAPGRSRSESLASGTGKKHLQLNATASYDFLTDVTVALVGEPRCGKSAAISKGLKAYGLSEPAKMRDGMDLDKSFGYIVREGTLVHEHSPERVLRVLEVDSPSLQIEPNLADLRLWPKAAPRLDGVIVCYDVSQEASFAQVEYLLKGFRELKLPTVVFACKSDLTHHIESHEVYTLLNEYDVGLIEVSVHEDWGKANLRRGFDWLLGSIFRHRRPRPIGDNTYQNPASPDVLVSPPPWDISRSATATPIASTSGAYASQTMSSRYSQSSAAPGPTSPTRTRSTSDLLSSEHEKLKNRELEKDKSHDIMDLPTSGSMSSSSLHAGAAMMNDGLSSVDEVVEERVDSLSKDKDPNRTVPWATLEELLDKLLFLAVSGDDRAYISHFLLTYRRFARPRSVVLAMQKRMRQLDQPSSDPMFACFAQMRICHLLEVWVQDYPHDFAVGTAATALNALVKSIISKTHLLHYGSDFLPFLEARPVVDKDAAWALKDEEPADESDDSYSILDDEEDVRVADIQSPVSVPIMQPLSHKKTYTGLPPMARERKSSLPLTAKALVMANAPPSNMNEPVELSPKQTIRELRRISDELYILDSEHVAQEITRIGTKLFLQIEPRHWLQHTLVSGKKEAETDSIARFSQVSNHLADWVVSLILCHDKPKARSRQIEKLVEIAQKLRAHNNYSALRAFVAGINNAVYQGDPTMEIFQQRAPGLWKSLQSWDLLLQYVRSHRAYRMALRNTKGPCIPALEVHLSDLIRAHEGNPDFNPNDRSRIHWAKFSMIGKFINTTTQFQDQCRTSEDYMFPERENINHLLMKECVMDPQMQRSRITPPSDMDEVDDHTKPNLPRTLSRDNGVPPKEAAIFRRLKFWE
ncbi:hypothetical protein EW146_g3739 [Bondarzewia mesenterica]|uniref:Ras-GEF domain-containing protein n=1 Tax=Bondarzewia mesenterica TaxID=1095465 RepID=A0A4S4LWQ4_9AGAM|nr:hypothetical protein EW146_g3739 [Bondarzewia mesenterica]